MTHAVLVALSALVGGLVVGPFVVHAVVRWTGWRVAVPLVLGRVPAAAEVGNPPARCRRCAAPLAPGDLPAIVGLAAGGRCRRCGEPLAGGYLAMEAACALGWAAATAAVGWSAVLVPVLALVTGLIAMCAVDLAVMRIPTRFVYVTVAAVLAGAALVAVLDGPARRLAGAGVGVPGARWVPAGAPPRCRRGRSASAMCGSGSWSVLPPGGAPGGPTIRCSCRSRAC